MANSVGIIDAGYRGLLCAAVDNISDEPYTIRGGQRLFQLCSPTLAPISFELSNAATATATETLTFGWTYDYSDFTIIISKKDSVFPIHDDTPNKLLSGVVYIAPEKNHGTFFYNNKTGENKIIAPWETNKAVFFSRKERETWHSYEGDGVNDRVVLVFNLMTRRIKEVFKIEKKNYFLGNLRFKLNPYIYRFFKNTI